MAIAAPAREREIKGSIPTWWLAAQGCLPVRIIKPPLYILKKQERIKELIGTVAHGCAHDFPGFLSMSVRKPLSTIMLIPKCGVG